MSEADQTPRNRLDSIEVHMPEVDKFVGGLQGGVFEAYETLGMAPFESVRADPLRLNQAFAANS